MRWARPSAPAWLFNRSFLSVVPCKMRLVIVQGSGDLLDADVEALGALGATVVVYSPENAARLGK